MASGRLGQLSRAGGAESGRGHVGVETDGCSEGPNFARGERPEMAWPQPFNRGSTDLRPEQAQHLEPNPLAEAFHEMKSPLPHHDPDPGVLLRALVQLGLHRARDSVLEPQPRGNPRELLRAWLTLHLDEVDALV